MRAFDEHPVSTSYRSTRSNAPPLPPPHKYVGGDNQTSLSTGETDLAYGKGSYSFIGLSDSFWNQYIVLPNTIVFAEQHPLIVDAMPTRTET